MTPEFKQSLSDLEEPTYQYLMGQDFYRLPRKIGTTVTFINFSNQAISETFQIYR